MKLEVGMYIRHSGLDGDFPIIQKIIELREPGRCGGKYKVFTDKTNGWFIDSDYIEIEKSKYSFNIIDLIEVGDYVNGSLVVEVGEDRVFTNIYYEDGYYNSFVGADEDWNSSYVSDYSQEIICDYEIKSIVTHEQFEQMQYRIGE